MLKRIFSNKKAYEPFDPDMDMNPDFSLSHDKIEERVKKILDVNPDFIDLYGKMKQLQEQKITGKPLIGLSDMQTAAIKSRILKKYKFDMPEDYLTFLKLSNGFSYEMTRKEEVVLQTYEEWSGGNKRAMADAQSYMAYKAGLAGGVEHREVKYTGKFCNGEYLMRGKLSKRGSGYIFGSDGRETGYAYDPKQKVYFNAYSQEGRIWKNFSKFTEYIDFCFFYKKVNKNSR